MNRPAQLRPARFGSFRLRCCLAGWLVAAASANLPAAIYRAGSWPVDVTVVADQPTLMLGEPTWLSFAVRNLSEENLQILVGGDYGNELGRPDSFAVTTVRSDGKRAPQPNAGFGTGGLIGPKELPAGGSHVFRLFVPHWATFQEIGTYTISCRRILQLLRPAVDGNFQKQETVDVATEARTTLSVQPRDEARMGRLVTEWGETMLNAAGEKPGDEAVIGLAWIDDPRVVPYFRRALAIRSYALKFIAVQAIAKFATDEALDGLKAAMQTKPSDFDYAAGESKPHLAANIRAAAAGALGRCQHPRAREFLIAQRRDESEGVRITVLHALSRMPPAEAVPLLQEMTRDPSARVSDEAKRTLALLRAPAEASTRPPPKTAAPRP